MPARSSHQNDTPEKKGLMVRLILILLVSAFSALGFSSLTNDPVLFDGIEIVINLASVAGIGLISGFFTRILLPERGAFLRWIVSLTGLLAGLLVFGGMTGWQYGIGPLYFSRITTDWLGLGLIILGSVSSLIADRAYRKSTRMTSAVNRSSASELQSGTRHSSAVVRSTNTQPRRTTPETRDTPWRISGQKRKNTVVKAKKLPAKKKKPAVARMNRTRSAPTAIKKRSAKKIVIAPVEEHRCPYCLEPVKRNDPRGVVECSICHTLHHADCWAITGTCQVPHYNH